jgi:hypothetical protein
MHSVATFSHSLPQKFGLFHFIAMESSSRVVEILDDDDDDGKNIATRSPLSKTVIDISGDSDSLGEFPTPPAPRKESSKSSHADTIIDLTSNDDEMHGVAVMSLVKQRPGPTDSPIPDNKRQKRGASNAPSQKRAEGRPKARRIKSSSTNLSGHAEDQNLWAGLSVAGPPNTATSTGGGNHSQYPASKEKFIADGLVRIRQRMLPDITTCPPQFFFAEETRERIILVMPTTLQELLDVNGVGRYIVRKQGQAILDIITQANGLNAVASQVEGDPPTPKMKWTPEETECLRTYMAEQRWDFLRITLYPWEQVKADNAKLQRFEAPQIKDKFIYMESTLSAALRMPRKTRRPRRPRRT